MMRKSSLLLLRAVLASGAALATCTPAVAGDMALGAVPQASMERPGQPAMRNPAIALRAQWLARGHTVQQLAALVPPAITGGSVAASKITVGAAGEFPSLSISYTTDTPGLSQVAVQFVSPNGETAYGGGYATYYYTQGGTLNFAIATPLGLYSSPGKWTIASATIYDNAGNSTTYSASQLAALFTSRSFTVVNTGPVDNKPPRILAGALLSDTVSLSAPLPTLAATITAHGRKGPGIYLGYVTISPPGGGYSYYTILPYPRPVPAGKIKAYNTFNQYSPTGTWNIVGFGVCDFASNCSGSSNDSDIIALFGTDTFTVTP